MKTAVVLSSLVAVCLAAPSGPAFYAAGPAFAPFAPYAHAPLVSPVVSSQYHSQDELGQYTYGYMEPLSSKAETKTFDGITRGGYSYLDSNGLVQTSQYVSDPVNGFRVAATNLPVAPLKAGVLDTPEVAEAKAAHFAALHKAEMEAAVVAEDPEAEVAEGPAPVPVPVAPFADTPAVIEVEEAKLQQAADSAQDEADTVAAVAQDEGEMIAAAPDFAAAPAVVATPAVYSAPVVVPAPAVVATPAVYSAPAVVAAPAVFAAPVAYAVPAPMFPAPAAPIGTGVSTQYHSQDENGQYSYGYAGGPSAKAEMRTYDGITRGGYSYLDSYGLIQTSQYVSDPVNGFRVAATNLPFAPAPQPNVYIADSPTVSHAKAEHFAAHAEAHAKLATSS